MSIAVGSGRFNLIWSKYMGSNRNDSEYIIYLSKTAIQIY
jgi:hypothetical protein